ncbi:MAG: hypothetical protein HN366_01345 [Deltaproteobacteria bacterium]|nr:hypothetical protein [Deltaproteobacteria bacterium]
MERDWLLVYTITDFELRSARLGSHSYYLTDEGRRLLKSNLKLNDGLMNQFSTII